MLFSGDVFGKNMSAEQIIEKSQQAFYYPANDMKVRIAMKLIDSGGGIREREMTMLRRDVDKSGKQKYFVYFHKPGDVRRMSFMVWKDPAAEDQRWIFIPAVDLVRRIAADDKRSSFVGSDFTYEDVSGRDVDADSHSLLREEKLGDRESYVIQSTPKEAVEYTKRVSWIDKQTLLPLKEEYYDAQDELFRVFTADKIETISGWPTALLRIMKNIKNGHRTEVVLETIAYDLNLADKDFSERRMRRPPRAWLK
jgi:outer membrane lipoprotein-sorting protein